MNQISTLHRAEGIGLTQSIMLPAGMNVEEMALATHTFSEHLCVRIRAPEGHFEDWIDLPRDKWRVIRPKKNDVVLFGYRMQGGGKNIFATIASVLVAVLLPGIGTALAATALGTFGAALVTAAIGVGATLAINALFPASSGATADSAGNPAKEKARQFTNVESGSNVSAKESFLPFVAGFRRLSPPEIASPLLYLDNGTQTINRIFALDGHHHISGIQVDGAPIDDFSGITSETRDGAEATSVSTFVDKISKYNSVGETLSTFSLDGKDLVDQELTESSEPRWVRFVTIADSKLEEIIIRLQIDSFIKSDSGSQEVAVPVRLRFRPKGSQGIWFNLPEIYIYGRDISTSLKDIRIRYDDQFGGEDTTGDIKYRFFQRVPEAAFILSDGSTGDQWQAHDHFVSGVDLTSVKNISGKRNGLRVVLDEDIFPRQEYEWEIIRGFSVVHGALNPTNYVLAGDVNSLFVARNSNAKWQVPIDQGAYVARVTVSHVTSVVDRQPCQRPKTALIAIKSRGQSIRNVTGLFSEYVYDWDGEGWKTLTLSTNPALHYRKALTRWMKYVGYDLDLIPNSVLLGWRQECIDQGYEVSAAYAGASVEDTLASIAAAGFAKRSFSDQFSVDWFHDRSSEPPAITFSPRNATISLEWVFAEKPLGIRAKYQNENDDYRDDEIQVNNPFYTNFSGYEVRSYDMISNPHCVEKRAYFDLLQKHYQQRRAWIIEASIEGAMLERGSLIGVVSDLKNDTSSGARVRKVIDTTNFTIDQEIPTQSTQSIFEVPDIFDLDNIFNVGAQSVCIVSTPNGCEMRTIVAAEKTEDGNVIRVDQPFSSADFEGAHMVLGPASDFTSRVIVSEIIRKGEERAQLICVDEAPEIHRKLQERFAA